MLGVVVIGGAAFWALSSGQVDEWMQLDKKVADTEKSVREAGDATQGLVKNFENSIPRLHPDRSLAETVKKYRNASAPGDRVNLAMDMIMAKARNDLKKGPALSESELAAYTNGEEYMTWLGQVLARAVWETPDSAFASLELGDLPGKDALTPATIKSMLLNNGPFLKSQVQCDLEKLKTLEPKYSAEYLGMHLNKFVLGFLAMDARLQNAAYDKAEPSIVAATSPENREAVNAFFDVRQKLKPQRLASEHDHDKPIADLAASGEEAKAFEIYRTMPECFRSTSVVTAIKGWQYFATKAKAEHVLAQLQKQYAATQKLPTEPHELYNGNAESSVEKFYQSPSDGWGRDFTFKISNNRIEVTTDGPDRKPGTSDDYTAAEGPATVTQ